MSAGQLCCFQEVLLAGLALDVIAKPLAGTVHRSGERPVAAPSEQAHQLVVQPIRPQRGDADLAAAVDDAAHHLGDARVIGHRGADQADPTRVLRHAGEDDVRLDHPHPAVCRSPHDAVGAAARAAARRLGHEHGAELGVRRHDLRAGGEEGVVGRRHRRDPVAVARRDVEAGAPGQRVDHRGAPSAGRLAGADELDRGLLRFAHHDHVAERGERHRVREGEGAAGHHDRIVLAPVLGQGSEPGQLEAADEPGDLQLEGDREGDERVVADRHVPLEREERPGGRRRIVRQDCPVGRHPGLLVQGPVDRLVAERGHGRPVGAGVDQGEPERRILADRAGLRRQIAARIVLGPRHEPPHHSPLVGGCYPGLRASRATACPAPRLCRAAGPLAITITGCGGGLSWWPCARLRSPLKRRRTAPAGWSGSSDRGVRRRIRSTSAWWPTRASRA